MTDVRRGAGGRGRRLDPDERRAWFLDLLEPAAADNDVEIRLAINGLPPGVDLAGVLGGLLRRNPSSGLVVEVFNGRPVWRAVQPRCDVRWVSAAGLRADATGRRQPHPRPGQPRPLCALLAKTGPDETTVVLTSSAMVDAGTVPLRIARGLQAELDIPMGDEPPAATPATALSPTVAAPLGQRPVGLSSPERAFDLSGPRRSRSAVGAPVALGTARRSVADLAASCRTSEEAVLLAAFAVLVSRLGAGDHPVIGLRTSRSWRPAAGVLATSTGQPVRDLIAEAEVQLVAARVGTGAAQPLPRAGFRVLGSSVHHRGAVRAAMTEVVAPATRFDIELVYRSQGPYLLGRVDLMSPGRVTALGAQLAAVLEQFAADPRRRVAEVDTVGDDARANVGDRWSRAGEAAPDAEGLPQAVDRWARQDSSRPAVVLGGQVVTFGQLADAVDRLARRLRAGGVGADVRVAVYLRRSVELVVALLGILRAGGAYVPLDPAGTPRERTEWILADCGCRMVLTTLDLAAQLHVPPGVRQIVLDAADAEESPPVAFAPADPQDLAYVTYTSGSTGKPKGVMISHASLSNYLRWCVDAYLSSGTGAPVLSSVAFDLTVSSLFAPLLAGQPVVLAPDDADFDEVAELLIAHRRLGFVKLTPTHLDVLRRFGGPQVLNTTACLVVGGEALTTSAVRPWLDDVAGPVVYNEYGPTEACVANVAHVVTTSSGAGELVPIGRPIPNSEVFVLDEALRLVPPGEPGEIYLGGVCLARGYLGQPGRTAERFLPHPFRPGGRLYRTGDLGAWRPDGQLVYLGRADDQIKIRGYRIEPGEIEAALRRHPAVANSAVTVTSATGSLALVAHLVPQGPIVVTAQELRRHLETLLPTYMIPSSFRFLSQLPLTGNGKVDRASLTHVGVTASEPDDAAGRPGMLGPVWAMCREELGLPGLSVDDDLLATGADSSAMVGLAMRIGRWTGWELPLVALFEAPTARLLARLVEALVVAGAPTSQGGAS